MHGLLSTHSSLLSAAKPPPDGIFHHQIGLPLDLSVPSRVRLSKGGRSGKRAPDIHPGLRRIAEVLFEIGRERDRTGADRCAFSRRIPVWLSETKSRPLFTSLIDLAGNRVGVWESDSWKDCRRFVAGHLLSRADQTGSVGGGETILRTGPGGYTRPRFVGGLLSRAGVFQHGAHGEVWSLYISRKKYSMRGGRDGAGRVDRRRAVLLLTGNEYSMAVTVQLGLRKKPPLSTYLRQISN
jgi:hypothetical protein